MCTYKEFESGNQVTSSIEHKVNRAEFARLFAIVDARKNRCIDTK